MHEYQILSSASSQLLARMVSSLLNEDKGWQVTGGVAVAVRGSSLEYFQAVTRFVHPSMKDKV